MSESNDTGEKKSRLGAGKPLRLRRTVESGLVRQNFSHGRSKAVVVEKKRKRTIAPVPGEQSATVAPVPAAEEKPAAPAKTDAVKTATADSQPDSGVLHTLTASERDARAQALAEAKMRDAEDRVRAVEEEKNRAEREKQAEKERAEREAQAAKEAEQRSAEEMRHQSEKPTVAPRKGPPASERAAAPERQKKAKPERQQPSRKGQPKRRRGKLTIANALDDAPRQRSLASLRRQREREKQELAGSNEPRRKVAREVVVPEAITIQELSNRMAERGVDLIKYLMQQGQMLKINDVIDADTAQLLAEEFGHVVKRVSEADVEEGLVGDIDDEADMEPRPPVVTIMGHVDHGKTSLLDTLRETNIAAGESGGITQHIGAYQVTTDAGQVITFLDTPGHEAFTAMRARGANATDIVVLVVAADDGVMPQTAEAIKHAREAGVPIIVAINKIDKTGADPTRVRNELLQHEIVLESMGGDVLEVEVSATEKTNLDKLIDAISLQSEILELKANADRAGDGVVIESQLDRGRGAVATVLVQRGTLRVGDIVVAGAEWGKVRALIDERGNSITEAGPSMPIEILGLSGTPVAGNQFAVVGDEARAREIVEYRKRKLRDVRVAGGPARGSLEQMMIDLKSSGLAELPLVIKADVQGSAEAISGALEKLGTDEVTARIVYAGVGGVAESDVTLAATANAAILAFNVRANAQAREASARNSIEIRYYSIIYDLVDDVKAVMSGMLSPELRENFLGNAEVLEVFDISKVGKIAGCRITEGKVERGASVRLIRDNTVIHEGKLSTLKRFKDEVREVNAGQECGMAFENYHDLKQGDVIECFTVQEIARSL